MITLVTEKARIYFADSPFSAKDAIKGIGAKWDADRKQWWVGKAKAAEAAALVAQLAGGAAAPTAPTAPGEAAVVAARVTYKGKSYFLAGRVEKGRTHYDDRVEGVSSRDGSKVLLYSRDGGLEFWANRAEATVEKRYDRPQTIGGLARFAERAKAEVAPDNEGGNCATCRREFQRGGAAGLRRHLHDGCDSCGAEG